MMKKLSAGFVAVMLASAGAAQAHAQAEADAAGEASWIHVRVDEADGAQVSLNLPMSLVDVALDAAGEDAFDEDDLRLEGDVEIDDLRRMWRELRDAGDAEFVDVRDGDEHVRVFRRGDRVFVHVDEDDREKVRIEMPAAIVDALLGTEGDRLDVEAAARELARVGDREMVRIDDEGTTVRIWVDDSNTGE